MAVTSRPGREGGWIGGALVQASLVLLLIACGGGDGGPAASASPDGDCAAAGSDAGPAGAEQAGSDELSELPELASFDPELGLREPWFGDLDGMIEREYIRALVVYNNTQYFIDGGTQRGVSYEALREFERVLNQSLGRKNLMVHVVILPVERDELIPALVGGFGDIAAANLTVTPGRSEQVDFSEPAARGISEVVVTGPASPPLPALDALAGATIRVRRSSSYWESLSELSGSFETRGLPPIELVPVAEYLEDEDLLEMVNAGMLPFAVVDRHKARFWAQVFDRIVVRDDLVVRQGGDIAWAFRKNSPQLADAVNRFIRSHRQGTLFGNVVIKRYLSDTRWVVHPNDGPGAERFRATIALFRKFGERYGFDPLLLAAIGFQESQLDQSKRSHAGAVGVMQIKPATARDPNVGIADVGDLEDNIHAATKYLAFLRDRYFSDPGVSPENRDFFTLAAYNAGPAKVRSLRAEATGQGLDPDVWYRNVERVAARRIGRETVRYVSNITKYYIAYRMAEEQIERADGSSDARVEAQSSMFSGS